MAKILLVEDEPDNRDLIGMTLEMEGHEIFYAATGEEGIEQARHLRPHLILMDLSLPGGINGLEATRQLRSDLAFNDVFIVALTAHAMQGDRDHALSAGCDEYISKPIVDLRDFSAIVSRFVSERRRAGG